MPKRLSKLNGLPRSNFLGVKISELRRRRRLPRSLIRSKRLDHSVNLFVEGVIRLLPISEVGSVSRPDFSCVYP